MTSLQPARHQRFQDELQNSLIDFHNGLRATQGQLSLNVWGREGEVLVRLELPGFAPEQVDVKLHDNTVQIGMRADDESPGVQSVEPENCLLRERGQGRAPRELQFPFSIDAHRSSAFYDKGILELRLSSIPPVETVSLPVQQRLE